MEKTLNTIQLTFALILISTIITSDIPVFGGPVSRIGIVCKEQFQLLALTIMTILLQTIPRYIQIYTKEKKTHEDKMAKLILLIGWAVCLINTYKWVTRWEGKIDSLTAGLPWAATYKGMRNSVYYEMGFQCLMFATITLQ